MFIRLKMETDNDPFIIGLLNCLSTYRVDPRACSPVDVPIQLRLNHYVFKRDNYGITLEIDSDEERHVDYVANYLIRADRMMNITIEYNNKSVRVRRTTSTGALLMLITEGILGVCCIMAQEGLGIQAESVPN